MSEFEIEFKNIPCDDYVVSGYCYTLRGILLYVYFTEIRLGDASNQTCRLSLKQLHELEYQFHKLVYNGYVDKCTYGIYLPEDG